jgi:uncharacterized membrane protein
MPILCQDCAAQMPETAAFCPGCGRPTAAKIASQVESPIASRGKENDKENEKVGRLPENIAGALTYLTFIPAIVFLMREPYRANRFVRFHSIQCLLLWLAMLAIAALLKLASLLLFYLPVAGPLLAVLISVGAGLAAGLLWLVLVIKAVQGERFELPWLGTLAEQYSATD